MLIDERRGGKDPSARMRRGRGKKKRRRFTPAYGFTLYATVFFFPHPVNGPRFSLPLSYDDDDDDERDEVIRLSRVNSDLD